MEALPFTVPEPSLELQLPGGLSPAYAEILSPPALDFLRALHLQFEPQRRNLLQARQAKQDALDAGWRPDFLAATATIRSGEWQVAPLPADLLDRRVEITGPVDRKMIINALNSGAKVFMADFEDANTPSWDNNLQGQLNLRDAVNRTIAYEHPTTGKTYTLQPQIATLMVRPRGWHLVEKHLTLDGAPLSGSLVDFGLFFFHNAQSLIAQGSGPYFYLPKLENHLEARLWNEVFVFAQRYLDIPLGTIKATVLVETILASFELHEILWELREHSAGLNCGRWDYIFSYIKKFRHDPAFILPDRAKVTMTSPFLQAYTQLVVQTCHRRGVHAIGGMAAQIPITSDPEANELALAKVRADKLREVQQGHDGTWVAHPGLIPVAKQVFDAHMPTSNQIFRQYPDLQITAADLLQPPTGTITTAGLRLNLNVGILYLESWLRGQGAAALYYLMEDAATAEISRTQVWQWLRYGATLEDGRTITWPLVQELIQEELVKIEQYVGAAAFAQGRFPQAIATFEALIQSPDFIEFLTLPAYDLID